MNTLELKGSLLELIASIEDERLLLDVYRLLKEQVELKAAIIESENPANLVEDNVARKMINEWLRQ